jgi:hypothetical protein
LSPAIERAAVIRLKTSATIAAVAAVLGIGVGALVGLSNSIHIFGGNAQPAHPVWVEVQWPFPIDQWGKGKAFQCKAADCGMAVELYVRPKLGSCNCATGVGSDADLDRMSDFDLLRAEVSPLADGRPITVGWMKGRSRTYALGARNRDRSAISAVFNDRCDMIVATVVLPSGLPAIIEPSVMAFLNSKPMLHWAELELGI